MAGSAIAISVRHCTKRFGDLKAVDDLSLEVRSGEIFVLVGPDGAGKTTTLRMLTGLVEPDEGDIVVAGQDVRARGPALRETIGYMAQRFGLYPDLTVQENMAFYADLFGIPAAERDSRGRELLEITRMQPFGRRRAGCRAA
jgi:ABC-2 type transport system ATP-binding protein